MTQSLLTQAMHAGRRIRAKSKMQPKMRRVSDAQLFYRGDLLAEISRRMGEGNGENLDVIGAEPEQLERREKR